MEPSHLPCSSLTHPAAILTPSIGVLRWIRANPGKRRDGHLPNINVPTLFCSGTRDSFATVEELEAAASKLPNAVIHQLEGADHGFAVLKSSGRIQKGVWIEAADSLVAWLSDI